MRGFTLVEMMVTVAIGTILLSVAFGAYSSFRERTRVETAKEYAVSILQQGRLTALSQRSPQRVSVNFTNNELTGTQGMTQKVDVNLQEFTCSSTCPVTATTTKNIDFTSRGSVDALNMKVSSTSSPQEFFIRLNSVTGRVSVAETCAAAGC